jgi:hypothetical protein
MAIDPTSEVKFDNIESIWLFSRDILSTADCPVKRTRALDADTVAASVSVSKSLFVFSFSAKA